MSSTIGATAAQSPPRGLRKRLIAFFTVLMMALGFGGFSALPALASSTEGDSGSEPDSSAESLEEEDTEEDDEEDAVEEEEETAVEQEQEEDDAADDVESESREDGNAADEQEAAEEPAVQQESETVEEPVAEETELAEVASVEEPEAVEESAADETEPVEEISAEEPAADDAIESEEAETAEELDSAAEEESTDEVIEVDLMAAAAEEDEEDDQEFLETLQDESSVEVTLSEEEISEADARRWGIEVEVHGLEPDADVEILLNGETVASDLDVRWGVVLYTYEDELSPGVHTFSVVTGGETYNASVTVTPGGYEPVVEISEDEISERDAWFFGISIYGTGAEPGAEAEILLNGEAIATVTVDEFEAFLFEHHAPLSAGEHTFTVVVSGESFTLPVSVAEGGYDPFVHLSMGAQDGEHVIAEWDVSREGFAVTGEDFEPGSTVTASVAGSQVGTGTADEHGAVHLEQVVLELPVGLHTLTLTSEKVTGSVDFSVLADDDYYDLDGQDSEDLEAATNLRVATESELAAGELWTRSYAFPYSDSLDLYISGELEARGIDGTEQYVLSGLEPGSYTATWVFGELSASVDFTVVPDEQGTPAPQGSYEGTAQTSEETSVPLTFQIDENGVLTAFSSERWFQCVGYQGIPTDPFEFDWSVPATPITVDQPFEIRWDSYVISGIVNSDGSASGEAEWRIPCWGAIHDHWTAQADVVIPDPEPTPDPTDEPTAEPTPTEEPTTQPTPDPTDEPTTEPTPTQEPTTGPTDEPTAEPTSEPTTAPTPDPTADPTAEPTSEPTADPSDPEDQSGISAPSTAVAGAEITITVGASHAGDEVSVWLHSDPVLLGTPTVSQAGTVEVVLPEDVVGEHTLEVTDADGAVIGTSAITITASADGTGADGAGGSGADDEDPASTDDDSEADDDASAVSSGDDTESDPTQDGGAGDGSTDAAPSESTSGEEGSENGESAAAGLAATGTTVALVAIGAGVLMLLGVAVLSLSRRRSHQTAK